MIEYIHMFAHVCSISKDSSPLLVVYLSIFTYVVHRLLILIENIQFLKRQSRSVNFGPRLHFFYCYSLYWSASRMRQKIYLLWNSHHLHVILVHTQVQDYLVCKTVFSAIEYSNHNGIVFDTNWFALINKWIEILCP